MEEKTMEKKYNEISMEYPLSAREYFDILKLALCHVDGIVANTFNEVMQAPKTEDTYRMACKLAKTLYA